MLQPLLHDYECSTFVYDGGVVGIPYSWYQRAMRVELFVAALVRNLRGSLVDTKSAAMVDLCRRV